MDKQEVIEGKGGKMTPQEKELLVKRLFNKYGGCVVKESTCERIVEETLAAQKEKRVGVEEIEQIVYCKFLGMPNKGYFECGHCGITNKDADKLIKAIYNLIGGKEKE